MVESRREWSVAALARESGLSRYKTERLLASLELKGFVGCATRSLRYEVRSEALLAGESPRDAPPCRETSFYEALLAGARPVLESLARRHNEAMYLTILKGNEVLFLDLVECRGQDRAESFLGMRYPFFSNAAGKVMRAIDSWDLLEKIGRRWRCGHGRYPELACLQAELEQIREKGVAVDYGGMGEGIITVAVAVRDYAGKVVAALTLLGPSFRLLGERLEEEIIPSLRSSGELLSMKFGYERP